MASPVDSFPLEPEPPRRINRPLRAVLATLLFIPLIGVTVAYHDGAVWVDSIRDVTHDGPYRLKGKVAEVGGSGEALYFDLQDASGSRRVLWNHTQVAVDRAYLVVGSYDKTNDTFQAEAVVRSFFFR